MDWGWLEEEVHVSVLDLLAAAAAWEVVLSRYFVEQSFAAWPVGTGLRKPLASVLRVCLEQIVSKETDTIAAPNSKDSPIWLYLVASQQGQKT